MDLVTGGAGLIGSHLLYKLASNHQQVDAVVRNRNSADHIKDIFEIYTERPEDLLSFITWHEGDLEDQSFVYEITKNIRHVYHCAAVVSFDAADRKKLIHSNQRLTASVVDACLENRVKKLCHVSSIAALPSSTDGRVITENDGWPRENNSPYSEGKVKSEYEVWRGAQEGLSVIVVNPSVVIGPGTFNSGSGSLFKTVNKGLKYYPGGSAGFIDVLDVAEIMIRLLNSDIEGERFILNGQNMMFRDVLILMSHYLGVSAPTKPISKKTLERIAYLEKIRSLFTGSRPRISKDGIPAMVHLNRYDSSKIKEVLNHTFLPVEGAIERTARYFLDVQPGRH